MYNLLGATTPFLLQVERSFDRSEVARGVRSCVVLVQSSRRRGILGSDKRSR